MAELSVHSDEFRLIEAVRRREPPREDVSVGIGDDAAVLSDGTLLATDTLLEGVHFLAAADPAAVGHKALAVNLSDIAAMGGQPTVATVALTVGRSRSRVCPHAMMRGLQKTAAKYDVAVVGGDVTAWDGPLAITVTVLGTTDGLPPLLRSGASAGDCVCVTGPLGGSIHGRHLAVRPRLDVITALRTVGVSSLIDLSDGLASDAAHVAAASAAGIQLNADAIPVHADVRAVGHDAIHHALTDGEDFELMATLPADRAAEAEASVPGLVVVGVVASEPGVCLRNATGVRELPPEGFSHTVAGEPGG